MKRRICIVGLALACLPALVAATATAANSKSKSSVSKAKVTCSSSTSVAIPAGENSVSPPAQSGTEYGTISCNKLVGGGVQRDTFNVPTSGNTNAKVWMYFKGGSLHGSYTLVPSSSSANFLEEDWTGTAKVTGGSGAFKGVTGTGTMKCKTLDGVHTTCTDKFKLQVPAGG